MLELALPMGFVGVLLGIKSAVEGTSSFSPETVPAYFPGDVDVFTPFTFSDYVTAFQAERVCEAKSIINPYDNFNEVQYYDMTGMPYQGNGWQVPMLKCDPRCVRNKGVLIIHPRQANLFFYQKLCIRRRRWHEIL